MGSLYALSCEAALRPGRQPLHKAKEIKLATLGSRNGRREMMSPENTNTEHREDQLLNTRPEAGAARKAEHREASL